MQGGGDYANIAQNPLGAFKVGTLFFFFSAFIPWDSTSFSACIGPPQLEIKFEFSSVSIFILGASITFYRFSSQWKTIWAGGGMKGNALNAAIVLLVTFPRYKLHEEIFGTMQGKQFQVRPYIYICYFVHNAVYTVQYTVQCTVPSTVHGVHYSTRCTVQCTVPSTVYGAQYTTWCTVQYTVYSTVHGVQYSTRCTAQCTVYSTQYSA